MGCQRSTPPLARLEQALFVLELPASAATLGAFARYLDLLIDANTRMNLTSVREAEGIVQRHFIESAAFGAALRAANLLPANARVADVGSGAGFPGLPLKLLWPQIRLTLIEATSKKADFLRAVAHQLGLADVTVLASRAEAAGRDPAWRERFDLVVSRAVAPLAVLAELTLPLARVGGASAGIKGSRLDAETIEGAPAIARLGGGIVRALPLSSAQAQGGPAPRCFVIAKQRPTPPDLPRRAGVTSANPLR